MPEPVFMFFIVIAIMTFSVMLFGGWVAFVSVKGIGKLMALIFTATIPRQRLRGPSAPSASAAACPRCRQSNPSVARYCRRCGMSL